MRVTVKGKASFPMPEQNEGKAEGNEADQYLVQDMWIVYGNRAVKPGYSPHKKREGDGDENERITATSTNFFFPSGNSDAARMNAKSANVKNVAALPQKIVTFTHAKTPVHPEGGSGYHTSAASTNGLEQLNARNVGFESTKLPPFFDRVARNELKKWKEALLHTFQNSEAREVDFDKNVFEAVKGMIQIQRPPDFPDPLPGCVLEYHENCTDGILRATILVRQLKMKMLRFGPFIGPASPDSACDHCVVVAAYNRTSEGWSIGACTEVIEFKMSSAVNEPEPLKAISQGGCYVATLVLPSLCMAGRAEDEFPFTIISCRTLSHTHEPPFFTCCLKKPKFCGEPFKIYYSQAGRGDNDAVRLYASCVRRGMATARNIIGALAEPDSPVVVPLGGQKMFVDTINIKCVATSVRDTNGIYVRYADVGIGKVTAGAIRGMTTGDIGTVLLDDEIGDNEEIEVFAKTSSALLHGWGVQALLCHAVLREFRSILKDHTKLIYFEECGSGLMTIMANLRKLGYVTLLPDEWDTSSRLAELWESFGKLVENVLLPMAVGRGTHAIYTDLRVGYDVMGNVMVRIDDADLQLIDMDSFLPYSGYVAPNDDKRYIPKLPDAKAFLLCQIFMVGISWEFKARQVDFDVRSHSTFLFEEL